MAFAQEHGANAIELREWEGQNGRFHSLIMEDPEGNITLVGFSKSLGELSPEQIMRDAKSLRVAKVVTQNGEERFSLYRPALSMGQGTKITLW